MAYLKTAMAFITAQIKMRERGNKTEAFWQARGLFGKLAKMRERENDIVR